MLREAIAAIREMADQSATPREVDLRDPRRKSFVVGDQTRDFDLPEPPRAHSLGRLDDLIDLANRFAGKSGDDAEAGPVELGDGMSATVVVWYDADRVVAVLDDAGHRVEHATLALHPSDLFARVVALRKSPGWLDQKDFVRLLRIDLAGTLDPVHLLNVVRRVRFEAGQVTSGEVKRDKESLGREITSRVSAEGEIPEEVTLDLPVYSTPGVAWRYGLRCSVEVDPTRGTFRLIPLPDEIERVQQLAVERIGATLDDELGDGTPSYYGRP
jgi:hypothetical protein